MLKFLLCFLLFSSPTFAGVDFDGSDDSIILTSSVYQPVSGGNEMTVAAWVKIDDSSTHRTIIGARDSDSNEGWYFYWNQSQPGLVLQGASDGGSGFYLSDTFTPSTTLWEHWAVTYDRDAGSATFYRDATAIGTDTAGDDPDVTTVVFHIGARNTEGTLSLLMNGKIDELAIWAKALTAGEIAHLHGSQVRRLPLQIQASSLRHYWPLDDVSNGAAANNLTFIDLGSLSINGTGSDGAGNDGMLGAAGEVLTYP